MLGIIFLFLILMILFWSISSKMLLNKKRPREFPEVVSSPVSKALTELLGTAGGIYLSLVMLGSFLGLQIPERLILYKWSLDPLAFFSLSITLMHPIITRLLQKNNRKYEG